MKLKIFSLFVVPLLLFASCSGHQLAKYLLQQKSVEPNDGLYLTNTGYILAGLMLEKASGKAYKELEGSWNKIKHL
ncbi:MAG: hypothetical protein QM768_15165 [Agriterribacter sp.]